MYTFILAFWGVGVQSVLWKGRKKPLRELKEGEWQESECRLSARCESELGLCHLIVV